MDLNALATKAETLADKTEAATQTVEATAGLLSDRLEAAVASGAIPALAAPVLSAPAKPGYDHLIDAMNRLPRPILALTTTALFLVAAIAPTWFEARMTALSTIPEPLWWLAGAVITMFFGSREAYYRRQTPPKP